MTESQYSRIGKLAMSYNAADELITYAACALIQCEDFDVAEHLIYRMTFDGRVQELKWLVDSHVRKKQMKDASVAVQVKESLDVINGLAIERNRIFHARVGTTDEHMVGLTLRAVKTGALLNVSDEALGHLVNQFSVAMREFANRMARFMGEFQISTKQVNFDQGIAN